MPGQFVQTQALWLVRLAIDVRGLGENWARKTAIPVAVLAGPVLCVPLLWGESLFAVWADGTAVNEPSVNGQV